MFYVGQTIDALAKRWRDHQYNGDCLIRYRAGDPTYNADSVHHRQIRNILLYNAMADHGLDKFKIELIIEAPNDQLNELEAAYIAKYNSLSPIGYNSMSGGGSHGAHTEESKALMREMKAQNIENNRSDDLNGMSMYLTIGENNHGKFIRIQKHSLCKDKYFYVKKYGTLDNAKQACTKFIADLESSGIKYKGRKSEDGLPKGIKPTSKGYKLEKTIDGKVYYQGFESQKYTREQNKQRALDYYSELMKKIEESKSRMQFND